MGRRFFELILAIKQKCQCNEEEIREQLGLSSAQFHGLIVLEEGIEIGGCEFARRMGLSASRGSRVLNKLVEDGFAKAQQRSEDRRSISICLTPPGARMKARIAEHMGACEGRITGKLDETGMRKVRDALELLEAVL